MSKKRSKYALRILESGFFTVGVILLASFVFFRAWGSYQANADIKEFEQAMQAHQLTANVQQPGSMQVASQIAGQNFNPAIGQDANPTSIPLSTGNQAGAQSKYSPEPDYGLWSEKRINDYHASNIERDDPPLAILTIEKLGMKVPIYDGTDEVNLNRGAGRIRGTSRIDVPGNVGIAGHRDGYFRALKDIAVGDTLDMLTFQGKSEFVVSSITIVDPSDVSVLAPTDDATLTLVTCYPFYFVGHAPKRYIVKGELVPNQVSKL